MSCHRPSLQIAAKEAMLATKRQGRERQQTENQQHNELLMELSQTIGDMEGKPLVREGRWAV